MLKPAICFLKPPGPSRTFSAGMRQLSKCSSHHSSPLMKREGRPMANPGAARAYGGDLLDGDHRVRQRAALPAVGLGKGDAHQPLRAHEFGDVERIAWIVRAPERVLFEMGEREAANRVGEGLLLFGEVELHSGFPHALAACRPFVALVPDGVACSGEGLRAASLRLRATP